MLLNIEDENQILNLNYMAIYIMLTADEIAKHDDILKSLNKDKKLTRGIFRFEVMKKGNTPYDKLPSKLTRGTAGYNLLVRVINDRHNIYCYGIALVNWNQTIDGVRSELSEIVDEICRKNLLQWDGLYDGRRSDSALFAQAELHKFKIVREMFEKALAHQTISKKEAPALQLQNAKGTADMRESRGIAEGISDGSKSAKLEMAFYSRNKPTPPPTISIYQKDNVPNGKFNKNGKEKRSFGLEIHIDGDVLNFPLTKIEDKMLYLSVLMAKRAGLRLRRMDFSDYARTDNEAFLQRMYKILQTKTMSYADWKKKMNTPSETHRINISVSNLSKQLWELLSPRHKDAYYYLCLVNVNKGSKSSYYSIRIRGEHQIHFSDYFMKKYNLN